MRTEGNIVEPRPNQPERSNLTRRARKFKFASLFISFVALGLALIFKDYWFYLVLLALITLIAGARSGYPSSGRPNIPILWGRQSSTYQVDDKSK